MPDEVTGAMPGVLEECGLCLSQQTSAKGNGAWTSPQRSCTAFIFSALSAVLTFPGLLATAQAVESGPEYSPPSSQRHYLHLAGAYCTEELGRETSGPAGGYPGHAARAPCAVASALGCAPQSASCCSFFSSPPWKLFIC